MLMIVKAVATLPFCIAWPTVQSLVSRLAPITICALLMGLQLNCDDAESGRYAPVLYCMAHREHWVYILSRFADCLRLLAVPLGMRHSNFRLTTEQITLRLSGSPTQLNKEARSRRGRSKRLFGARSKLTRTLLDKLTQGLIDRS
jgi:hypothetical protein